MASTHRSRKQNDGRVDLASAWCRLSVLVGAAVVAILLVACGEGPSSDSSSEAQQLEAEREKWTVWSEAEEQWRNMELAEDLIIQLTPEVGRLANGVMNLALPAMGTRGLFAPEVVFRDLAAGPPELSSSLAEIAASRRTWSVAATNATASSSELQLWRPLFDEVLYFENAKFKIKLGQFNDVEANEFDAKVVFDAKARSESGRVFSIHGWQRVVWRNQVPGSKGEEADWRIVEWISEDFHVLEGDSPLFEEVLASALVDREDLARARDSIHERYVVDMILDPEHFKPPHRYFTVPSEDFHPGIAVVDLDRDGFDDFYVMARWGPNMFFHNRGDGSFEEIGKQLGLDIEDHSSSAIFADFDNDGDLDLMLGRTLARSEYLVNENGRFVARSKSHVSEPLPYFTSSVSAVDYDSDGLLDIYLSTYMKVLTVREFVGMKGRIENGLLAEFLPRNDSVRLAKLRMAPDFHQYINHPGPPNVLLRNIGEGRFKVVHDIPALRIFRNTFQSTWGDFDGDGDPDVYVANDFGPNNLVRNDGNGQFVDVTSETGTADIGFGMGASWGDYDNDGRADLYVSNMYSSAGNRILAKLDHVNATFLSTARGNTLFRNQDPSFEKVSGLEPPALTVEKAGWSWGGQFADLDNDGYQDIYALSGYYSAHKKVAIARDT